MDLRKFVLRDYQLPDEDREKYWKLILIRENYVPLNYYLKIAMKSPYYDKIINDSFRTLKSDKIFTSKVPHSQITRVLNATVNALLKHDGDYKFSYVQGMNVTLAPFLFVMNELDAFNCYYKWIQVTCPTYVQPYLSGVHAGLKIYDRILEILDPELYDHLKSKKVTTSVFAFSRKND